MNALALIALFGIAFALEFFIPMKPIRFEEMTRAKAEAIAYNMAIYEEAALNYIRTTPSFSGGAIDESSLQFPTGYRQLEDWTARVGTDGWLLVTQAAPFDSNILSASVAQEFQEMKGHAAGTANIGVVENNRLRVAVRVVSGNGPSATVAETQQHINLGALGFSVPDGYVATVARLR